MINEVMLSNGVEVRFCASEPYSLAEFEEMHNVKYFDCDSRHGFCNGKEIQDPDFQEMLKTKSHKMFVVGAYIHSGVTLSLSGEGMQCRFDTSNNYGRLFMFDVDSMSEEETKECARNILKRLTHFINGEFIDVNVVRYKDGVPLDDEWVNEITFEDLDELSTVLTPEELKELNEKLR